MSTYRASPQFSWMTETPDDEVCDFADELRVCCPSCEEPFELQSSLITASPLSFPTAHSCPA